MKTWVSLLALASLALPAAAQTRPAPPPCLTLAQVTPAMDPVALTRSMLVCLEQGKTNEAVDLYHMAGVFARFDTLRVSDRSAHSAYPALKAQAGQVLGEERSQAFDARLKEVSVAPGYQGKLCQAAERLGPPSYDPTYMTRHGMGAFTGSEQRVANFQAPQAWAEVRSNYLKCP